MIIIYILVYFIIGLIVVKCLEKRVEKDLIPLDMDVFIICIILWPVALVGMVAIGFMNIIKWFYDLGTKK